MQKVLHIVSSMDPQKGGVSQAIRNIIFDNKFSVNEVLCMDDEQGDYGFEDGFIIHKVGVGKTGFQYNPSLTKWLLKNLKHYSHVIVHGLWQFHNYATYKAVKKLRDTTNLNIKVSIMPHGMLDPYFQKAEGRKLKALRNEMIWSITEKKAVNSADALLFTCDEELLLARQTFKGYNPKKEYNVGLGVLTPPKESPDMKRAFQEAVGGDIGSYWLFLSRLHPKKGIDLLINSYKELNENNANMPHLVIAGPLDSEFAHQMVALAGDHQKIKFTGMITGNAKWGAIYGSDLFLLPSHQENFGIAVVEAIACSKPVAITDKVNIYTVIRDTNSGFIFQDNFDGTKGALMKALECNSAELLTLGKNAKLAYLANYLPESAAKNVLEALKKN